MKTKVKSILVIAALTLLIASSCDSDDENELIEQGCTNDATYHNPEKTYGSLTDQQGNTYKTIIIGSQVWMAENLKTSRYRNGDLIPNITEQVVWEGISGGAWCNYENDSQYDCPYGKLYNWYTVSDARNICPTGWHVPSESDWNTLIGYLDPSFQPNPNSTNLLLSSFAGGRLKSTGTQYWDSPNTNASNESGFSALPSGYRIVNNEPYDRKFYSLNGSSSFWSSTSSDSAFAKIIRVEHASSNVYKVKYEKRRGFAVRCIQD